MSLPEDTLRVAVLGTLADDVKAASQDHRDGLRATMEQLGIRSLAATLPDGTEVATLTLAGGKPVPKVTDEAKFLAWVQEAHPTETEVIVRPGYAEALLKQIRDAGRAVDPKSGEVVPGVEFTAGSRYVTPSYAKGLTDGRERIRQAHRDGTIPGLDGLLALPAPEAGEPR